MITNKATYIAMYVRYTYISYVCTQFNEINIKYYDYTYIGTCVSKPDDNGLSTGVTVAISIVVTFIITLVVTALITSLYYKYRYELKEKVKDDDRKDDAKQEPYGANITMDTNPAYGTTATIKMDTNPAYATTST